MAVPLPDMSKARETPCFHYIHILFVVITDGVCVDWLGVCQTAARFAWAVMLIALPFEQARCLALIRCQVRWNYVSVLVLHLRYWF